MSVEKEPGEHPDPDVAGTPGGPLSATPSAWGDRPEFVEQAARTENRRLARRWGAAVFVVVAATVAAVALRWGPFSPERLLEEARLRLAEVVKEGDAGTRAHRAAEAETLLRRYLDGGGRHRDSARLLLAGALAQRCWGREPTLSEQSEIDELLARSALDRCPTNYLVQGAWALASAGRADRADSLLAVALERGDEREVVLRMAAEVRLTLGITEPLLGLCRELAELRPDDPQPLTMMVYIYQQLGNRSQLVEVQRKLLELSPPRADEIRLSLIDDLVELGRAPEARKEFEALRSRVPELLAEHPMTEARLLSLEGQRSEAMAIARRLLAAQPREPGALLLAGRVHLGDGRLDEAIAMLGEAVRVDPTVPEAHYLLGQAYTRKGLADKAERQLEQHRRALELRVKLGDMERQAAYRPNDTGVRDELVRMYEELGWKERAEMWRRAGGRDSLHADSQLLQDLRALQQPLGERPQGGSRPKP